MSHVRGTVSLPYMDSVTELLAAGVTGIALGALGAGEGKEIVELMPVEIRIRELQPEV